MTKFPLVIYVEGPTSKKSAEAAAKNTIKKGIHNVSCEAYEIKGEPYEWRCHLTLSFKSRQDLR